jgi:hypothetical protein
VAVAEVHCGVAQVRQARGRSRAHPRGARRVPARARPAGANRRHGRQLSARLAGTDREGRRAVRACRLSLHGSRRRRECGRGAAVGRSRASAAALAEQPARDGGGADGGGALGRLGPAQHPRPAVREVRDARARGAAAPIRSRGHRVAGRAALPLGPRAGARGGHAHRGAAARRARCLGDGPRQRRHGALGAPRRRRAHRPVHPHRLAGDRAPHE